MQSIQVREGVYTLKAFVSNGDFRRILLRQPINEMQKKSLSLHQESINTFFFDSSDHQF